MRGLLLWSLLPWLPLSAQEGARVHLQGDVRDALNGRPVYATVELLNADGSPHAFTTVNDRGRYALFIPCGRAMSIRIQENGHGPFRQGIDPIPCGTATFGLDLLLDPR